MHIESGVVGVEPAGLVLGHKVFNSETGEVCTTVEQRVGHVELAGRAAVPLTGAQRRAAEARRRSEERRVGKECRTRWGREQEKKRRERRDDTGRVVRR